MKRGEFRLRSMLVPVIPNASESNIMPLARMFCPSSHRHRVGFSVGGTAEGAPGLSIAVPWSRTCSPLPRHRVKLNSFVACSG